MDFFESQELARKKTKWLIFLFGLAVIAITVAIFALAVAAISVANPATQQKQMLALASDWRLMAGVAAGVFVVVGLGSLTKMLELRHGGSAVAAMMGGRRIVGNAKQLTDRRVADVVEEMALASGMPVPPVYVLDNEESINAFAAGYTVDDAVIGINRGTVENLSREELQGVIAHEFSHILNGDMRMSLRMVAILNGIMLISIIGGQIFSFLSHTAHHSMRRSSRDDKGKGGFIVVMYFVAAGLYLIGSIGLFFGRWIKSTVSQQREYLADASAVQFTRIPDGIGNALKTIGGHSRGSHIQNGAAEQISHMFFGECTSNFVFRTHPPILNRIRVIDERFDGDFQKFMQARERRRQSRQKQKQKEKKSTKEKLMDFLPGSDRFGGLDKMNFPVNPLILIAGIGIPTDDDVEYSGLLVNQIPKALLEAVRETFSARCVVFASLLDEEEPTRKKQLVLIQNSEAKGTLETTLRARKMLDELPMHLRLGVFEIIQGTLSAMSPGQYPVFRKTVNDLIVADRKVDLFEFFLFHHLIVHLDRCFKIAETKQNVYKSINGLQPEIAQVLSILACVGQKQESAQRSVFDTAMGSLFKAGDSQSSFIPVWEHKELSIALSKLAKATPSIKKKVLSAAVMAISHDKVLTVQEVELFRAMAESMDCPVPPLVATHTEAPEFPDAQDIGDQ